MLAVTGRLADVKHRNYFVQLICIKEQITTGTKYDIMKKLNITNFFQKMMTLLLLNKHLFSLHTKIKNSKIYYIRRHGNNLFLPAAIDVSHQ